MDSEEIVFEMRCYGLTGSIADVSSGTPRRIVTGLASNLNQQEMVGPNDLTYVDGRLYVLETGAPQTVPDWLPRRLQKDLKRQYGALLDVTSGRSRVVANPGSVSYEWMVAHPELTTSEPASNFYSMAPKPGGGFYAVDAYANTLNLVDRRGRTHVLTWFPPSPAGSDAVPTCVDVGPDGAVYVGQLTGHGNTGEEGATAAKVYRYSPRSGRLTEWQTGFSAITGCGFGANGDFYVTQLDTTGFLPEGDPEGTVVQIARNGTRTVLGEGKLFAPSGFLAARDGSIYVANNTIWWPAGTTGEWDKGEIVKIG
jgi:sugar lactone lactonase YvrE